MGTDIHERHALHSAEKRTRLTVDISPELQTRIKIAAAQASVSMRDYVEGILDRSVPTSAALLASAPRRPLTSEDVERFLRNRIPTPPFAVDSATLIREAREERMEDL